MKKKLFDKVHVKRIDKRECNGEVIVEMAKEIIKRIN